MRITDPDQLYAGKTIFRVHVFNEAHKLKMTSIQKCKVLRVPITSSNSNDPNFIELQYDAKYIKINLDDFTWQYKMFTHPGHPQENSLQDMGVIPNHYNLHQTFDNLGDAKEYICKTLQVKIMEPKDKQTRNNYDQAMKGVGLN